MKTWPFTEDEATAVFTTKRILDGDDWIHYVTHDAEDGAWQFHPYTGPTPEGESAIVSLKSIVGIDDSVCHLADLPRGWHAWRESKSVAWVRAPQGK